MYYHDSTLAFLFLNLLLFGTACVFWIIKLVLYFKDRSKIEELKPGSPHGKSFMYTISQEMKSWTYYFNPENLSYML